MAVRRELLVSSVSSCKIDELESLIVENEDKRSSFSLVEVVSELSGSLFADLCHGLLSWCRQVAPAIAADDGHSEPTAEFLHGCRVLEATAALASVCLNSVHVTSSNVDSCSPLTDVTVYLNSMLIQLDCLTSCDSVAAQISLLSEMWCRQQLPHHQVLVLNVVIYLTQLYFDPSVKTAKPLLRRIAALRRCFTGQPDSQVLAAVTADYDQLLLRAVCSLAGCQPFIALDDGVRFVAQLLRVPQYREHVHYSVLAALWTASNGAAQRYGQVYYSAWKQAEHEQQRQWLEEHCIQDIMYRVIHCDRDAANSARLWRALYQLLHHWHGHHRHRDTAALLHRLYTPLLWRTLTAPNEWAVLNAAYILFDVFPLESPYDERETRDADLQRQCSIMVTLLTDRFRRVRCVAAKGVCKVLSQYWDLVPSTLRKKMIQIIIQELAFDSSSVEVRIQAVQSQMTLLDNPLSHVHMSSALPAIGAAFHDTDLMVRVAVCDLLLNIKSIQSIRYFDIVPVKHIIARLACDEPPVCRRLVQLMANSFFPANDTDETVLSRCIYLIQQDPTASRQFYLHSSTAVEIGNAVKLLVVIRQALAIHVRRHLNQQQKKSQPISSASHERHRKSPLCDKENPPNVAPRSGKRRLHNAEERNVLTETSQESGSSDDSVTTGSCSVLEQLPVVRSLVEVAGVLWTARMSELGQRPDLERQLYAAWTPVLPMLYNFYKDTEVAAPVMYLCSLVPHSAMAAMSSHCMSALRRQLAPEDQYGHYVEAMVNWGRAEDIIELSAEVLRSHLENELASFVASNKTCARRRSARGVRFREPCRASVPLECVCKWLMHMLLPSARRRSLVHKRCQQLIELVQWLSPHVQRLCEEAVCNHTTSTNNERAVTLSLMLESFLTLSTLLSVSGGTAIRGAAVQLLFDTTRWMTELSGGNVQWHSLCTRLCHVLSKSLMDCAMIGGCTPDLSRAVCVWLSGQLSRSTDVDWCISVLTSLSDLLTSALCDAANVENQQRDQWRTLVVEHSVTLTSAALVRLGDLSGESELSSRTCVSMGQALTALLGLWIRVRPEDKSDALAAVSSALVQLLLYEARRNAAPESDPGSEPLIPELTPVSGVVLTACKRHPLFESHLAEYLSNQLRQRQQLNEHQCGVLVVSFLLLRKWMKEERVSSVPLSQLLTDALAAGHSLQSVGSQNEHEVALVRQVKQTCGLLQRLQSSTL